MKKAILCIGAFFVATSLSAQINVGANFLLNLPQGNWNDPAFVGTAVGGGLEVNYMLMDNLSVGLEFGYSSFAENDGSLTTVTQIPISLKGEYYFMEDGLRPFAGLGFGYYLIATNFDGEKLADLNGIGLSPRVGAAYAISDALDVALNVNYNLLFGQKVDGEGDTIDDAFNSLGIGIGVRYALTD